MGHFQPQILYFWKTIFRQQKFSDRLKLRGPSMHAPFLPKRHCMALTVDNVNWFGVWNCALCCYVCGSPSNPLAVLNSLKDHFMHRHESQHDRLSAHPLVTAQYRSPFATQCKPRSLRFRFRERQHSRIFCLSYGYDKDKGVRPSAHLSHSCILSERLYVCS